MFNYRKNSTNYFSYRYFSGKAGFSSPNFLKLVTDGLRNLTQTSVAKIAKGFGLKNKERDYFENLVFMNQADTHDEKNHYYRKLVAINGTKRIRTLDKDQYEYFSKWYYPAIREIIAFAPDVTAETLVQILRPKISIREAQGALVLLERLQLIRKDGQGRRYPVDGDITTGPELKSMVAANFHKEMMRLADEAIDRFAPAQRDISGLTLSIPEERFAEIKDRLVAFRKELLALASAETSPDMVIQINMHLFPLTQSLKRRAS
jgi:uncharacterized protein (TIGR02147 family)